nr:MAG TPA: hypothetical protein [Caudoviricetes sp.]
MAAKIVQTESRCKLICNLLRCSLFSRSKGTNFTAYTSQRKVFFAEYHCNIKDNAYLCTLEREKFINFFN